MKNITYFIISFFISILTVIATLFTNPETFYPWLAFVLFLLLCPFLFNKICKKLEISKELNALIVQSIILCVVLMFAWHNIFPASNEYIVAITQSVTKANEIQDFLITSDLQVKLGIIPEAEGHPKSYAITVEKLNSRKNLKLSHQLLNSDLFDGSFLLKSNIKYTNNRIKMVKRLKKECENILYGLDSIRWLEVKIALPENINAENSKIKSITIHYDVAENADSQKIKKQIENFINPLFKDFPDEIIIEDAALHPEAFIMIEKIQAEFEKKNYFKVLELAKEASKLDNPYLKNVSTIPKLIELDKKIKNGSKNYQDYIEIGDLLSSFVTSLYCNSEAIKNYEKALELNPNAYEVYERIAHAYTNMMFGYSISADFSTDTKDRELEQKCREKSIEYYLKALEYTEGNDAIYSFLRFEYFENKDYNKALEYYNKVTPSGDPASRSSVANRKVFLNWKTGHYIEAYKETKDCSEWFCRLIRWNFTPNEI